MLVLTREIDQTIMIGDDIEVTVVEIHGNKVRLGVTAPIAIPIHRKEVFLALKAQGRKFINKAVTIASKLLGPKAADAPAQRTSEANRAQAQNGTPVKDQAEGVRTLAANERQASQADTGSEGVHRDRPRTQPVGVRNPGVPTVHRPARTDA